MHPHTRSCSEPIEWTTVSPRRPCRVCGATTGCRYQENEALACCANAASDWPLVNGAWLHRVAHDVTRTTPPTPQHARPDARGS